MRLNTNQEVWKQLTEVGLLLDSDDSDAASTTMNAAAAAGATALPVTSETDFSQGMLIRIGSGETLEENVVESTSSGNLTLRMPLLRAHSSGEAVVERMRVELGEPTEDGVTVNTEGTVEELPIATSRTPYLRQLVAAAFQMTFTIVNFNLENLAAAHGAAESNITGSGTSSSPYALGLIDTILNTLQNASFYAQGVVQNGTTYEVQLFAVEMSASVSLNLRIGVGAGAIPLDGQGKGFRWTQPALP